MNLTAAQIQVYRHTAKMRQQQHLAQLAQHRLHGFAIAQTAAQMLKSEFQAERVVVFGSLLNDTFHESSDLDLAVWGLPPRRYFAAVGKLLALSDFAVDLVEAERASPEILAAIALGKTL